jgi:hypothetical protein
VIVRGAAGALAGGAAVAAGKAAANRFRQPRVLGMRVPRELMPRKLDVDKLTKNVDLGKIAKNADVKKLARRVEKAAAQVEDRSEDLRLLSQQAKRLSRKLS